MSDNTSSDTPSLPALRWSGREPPTDGRTRFHSGALDLFAGGGTVAVGSVGWYCWPQLRDYRWRFYWSCDLPGGVKLSPSEDIETRTLQQAKSELETVVREWFVRSLSALQEDEGS